MNKCQNVECNNIGRKVTVKLYMEYTKKSRGDIKEIHHFYMCPIHFDRQTLEDIYDENNV